MIRKTVLLFLLASSSFLLRADEIREIYLVGKACDAGWDNSKALPLTSLGNGIFTWTGKLKKDQFKFLVNGRNDENCINAKAQNEKIVLEKSHSWNRVIDYNGNDYRFLMWDSGTFIITIDVNHQTLLIEMEAPPFAGDDFWLTGSAIPNDAPVKLERGVLAERFIYNGTLKNGELKIINTSDITEKTRYCIPINEDENLLGANLPAQTVANASLPGWKVEYAMEGDLYKFYFDIKDYSISAKKFIDPDALFLVGGATTAGWNSYYPVPFEKDTNTPHTYKLFTRLRINNNGDERDLFKILLQTEWQPYSYHPPTPNESITEARYFVQNLNDHKWKVNKKDEGDYLIVVNVWEETIRFWKDGEVSGIETADIQPVDFYSEQGNIRVKLNGTFSLENVEIFDLSGQKYISKSCVETDSTIADNLSTGVYIYRYSSEGNYYIGKIIVK